MDVIFQKSADPFLKRIWQTYLTTFSIIHSLICIPFLVFLNTAIFSNGSIELAVFSGLILLVLIAFNIWQCYKWMTCKIISVTFSNDVFTIIIVNKDEERSFQILIEDINTRLYWRNPNKQYMLTLCINKGNNLIAKVYACRKKDEFDLKNIPYQIYKQKAVAANNP
ncbi:hypothetical protein KXQ82_01365 [Mucilaginibacter sp. HMF5004]|uniref:hypothetical protein n=1 Tax=Mucilaginibacter rivuli TaxID=2857527 RepID=UPI001C5DA24B|nr:hypothetical protein [Mucilaginibacter rivuli]MBW4888338.1 hypothetical protein [Mucilaginibacter rivuli]